MKPPATRAEVRQLIVDIALGEIGHGRPAHYWADVLGPDWQGPYPKHWCGALALWCLRQALIALHILWQVGKGFCEQNNLSKTKKPKKGDVAYFTKLQHHALVVQLDGDHVVTVDGNQGATMPVQQRRRHLNEVTCFYSIESLLAKAGYPPDEEEEPTLRIGSKGATVETLQAKLNTKLGATLKVDGDFGPKTEAAVKALQSKYALPQNGVVTPQVWEALLCYLS
ncbi:MAG TPA: peptidoglycan-binding protein [Polyangiaceae bacterium]|nr:peptidoglycan-binding protein [Polyangiaceae bacterium]